MYRPMVSIIMSTYNPTPEYMKLTIESILKQTYKNWELIIIDDGSINDVETIVAPFQDERIVYKRCEINRGMPACLNEAIALAKGSMLARMDDDDIAYENWLETMLAFFNENLGANVAGCYLKLLGDKEGYIISELPKGRLKQQANMIIQNGGVPHPMCMLKKDFLNRYYIRYNANCKFSSDYALWVEILKYSNLDCIPKVLGLYRRHQKQMSTQTHSTQQNYADEIRWNQMRMFQVEPNQYQKQLHNKLCKMQMLEKDELTDLAEWIKILKVQNAKHPYFGVKELRQVLHQRAATLYLRYFKRTHDIEGIKYFLMFATIQNLKNGMTKVSRYVKLKCNLG